MTRALLSIALLTTAARAEVFKLHNLFGGQDNDLPYFENEMGIRFKQVDRLDRRFLQGGTTNLETGTLGSINQTANTCATTALEVVCNVQAEVSATDETLSGLGMTVRCDLDSQVAFDFRRASNCRCGLEVRDEQGNPKDCGCVVCPFGFGISPVSIECDEDFIIGECTTLDCGFGCNGTCSFDCANSGPECTFCDDFVGAPTVAPTGEDDRQGTRRPSLVSGGGGGRGRGAKPYNLVTQAVVGALVGMALYVAV